MTTISTTVQSRHRFRALDGLRGVAALFVVLLHVEWSNHLTYNNLVQNGYLAVDLFFILSGFVISYNYSNQITNFREAWRFIGLRFYRLYPLHIAVLASFIGLECAKLFGQHALAIERGAQPPFTGTNTIGAAVANLFLVNGLHVSDRLTWNGASWSISCEFAAYLVFSLVIFTGLSRTRLFFVSGFLMAVAGYVGVALGRGNLNVTADWGIIRCFAGFFFGMLIFKFRGINAFSRPSSVIGGLGFGIIVAVIVTMSLTSGSLIVLVIPLLVITIALLQTDKGFIADLLNSSPAQFLGRISYSIYMIHFFLIVCLLITLKRIFRLPLTATSMRDNPIVLINPWVGDLLVLGMLVLVIATASTTYAFIEEPGRLFGRRIFAKSRTQTLHAQISDKRPALALNKQAVNNLLKGTE